MNVVSGEEGHIWLGAIFLLRKKVVGGWAHQMLIAYRLYAIAYLHYVKKQYLAQVYL